MAPWTAVSSRSILAASGTGMRCFGCGRRDSLIVERGEARIGERIAETMLKYSYLELGYCSLSFFEPHYSDRLPCAPLSPLVCGWSNRWQKSPLDEAPRHRPAVAGGAAESLRGAGVGLLHQVSVGAGLVATEAEGYRGGDPSCTVRMDHAIWPCGASFLGQKCTFALFQAFEHVPQLWRCCVSMLAATPKKVAILQLVIDLRETTFHRQQQDAWELSRCAMRQNHREPNLEGK